jgi:hypothetical protein
MRNHVFLVFLKLGKLEVGKFAVGSVANVASNKAGNLCVVRCVNKFREDETEPFYFRKFSSKIGQSAYDFM